jgi:purine-binding chemotaxis protein CheW
MIKSNQLVVFSLNEQRYALYLHAVERIIRAVDVTPLPEAPDIIIGIINLQGQIIPVANIRRRFGLLEQEIDLSNQLIIASTSRRTVALVVDSVNEVIEPEEEKVILAEKITPGMELIDGVIKLEDGMILIHDLDRFLSLEEETLLDRAMDETRGSKG